MKLHLTATIKKAGESILSREAAIEKFERIFKKEPDMLLEYNIPGTFRSVNAAEKSAKENGYIVGRMCYNMPIGIAHAEDFEYIAKWENISSSEWPKLAGVILFKDAREGNAWLVIK